LANNFDSGDDITIYVLCKYCRSGTTFRSDSILDGWRVLDSKRYRISTSSRYSNNYNRYDDRYNDRYNDRYDDDYDLEISRVRYSYDLDRNDAEVRLITTIENVGDREIELDELEYTIEVDGDRLSSRDYDIDHVRTRCDDSNVRSSRSTRIDIERRDECEITVEITFDADDVEDEIMEIEVELDSSEDRNSRNDNKTVRFRLY
jgi:hypothetical protein